MSRAKAVSVGCIASLLVALPLIVLTKSQQVVGQEVQPRYLYPLLIMFAAAVLLVPIKNAVVRLSRTQEYVIIVVLVAAQLAALAEEIRRYTTGIDNKSFNLNRGIEWWSLTLISPLTTVLIASAAFSVLAFLAVRTSPHHRTLHPEVFARQDTQHLAYLRIDELE